jgi:hypothetical protein
MIIVGLLNRDKTSDHQIIDIMRKLIKGLYRLNRGDGQTFSGAGLDENSWAS